VRQQHVDYQVGYQWRAMPLKSARAEILEKLDALVGDELTVAGSFFFVFCEAHQGPSKEGGSLRRWTPDDKFRKLIREAAERQKRP